MATPEGLRRFLEKRGIKVNSILVVDDGFAVVCRETDKAVAFLAQTAEPCEFYVSPTDNLWGRITRWLRRRVGL